jgi:hypothetical protein
MNRDTPYGVNPNIEARNPMVRQAHHIGHIQNSDDEMIKTLKVVCDAHPTNYRILQPLVLAGVT